MVGIFGNITGNGTNGAFVFKGSIAVAGDFPTSAEIQNGWTYSITADVVDNDPAKTNTGQSFKAGDIIAWNGTNWTDITGVEVWVDDGTNVKTINLRDIDLQSKGLKDTNVSTAIKLGDALNTAFSTVNKTIVGAINELKSAIANCLTAVSTDATLTGNGTTGSPLGVNSSFVSTWTNSLATLSTTTTAGTYSIDLSSYLPDDGAQYEVLMSNAEVLSDTDPYNIYIASDIITNYMNLFVAKPEIYETSSPFIIPVGAGRTLSYKLDGNLVSNVGLKVFGYRKVK